MTLDQYVLELNIMAMMIGELKDQIGKRVVVRDDLGDPWIGPFKLTSITPTSYAFHVSDTPSAGVTSFKFAKLAKLAKVQKKRVLIRDRARLARVLLDQGYLPSADGAFVSKGKKLTNRFPARLWNRVGAKVEAIDDVDYYAIKRYYGEPVIIDPAWTEEVEVADAE